MDKENSTKEQSLMQLLGSFIRWITEVFLNLIKISGVALQLLYRYKWLTIAVFVFCVAAGMYLSRPSAKMYKAEAMAVLHGGEAQTVREVLKQLENSLASDDKISLATKMGIPDSVSKNILEIRTFNVIDYLDDGTADKIDFKNTHTLDDTMNVKMKNRLYIRIKTRNIAQVPVFQDALLRYFAANPILNTQFEAQKKHYTDQIKICDAELQRIDSMAKVFYFKDAGDQMKFDNNKLIVGESRKQLFYNELLEINTRKAWAEIKLADCVSPVNFPSDFVVIPRAVNSRLKYGVISLGVALAISLIITLFISNFRNIFNFLENKK